MANLVKVFQIVDKLDDEALKMLEAAIEAKAFNGPLAPLAPFADEVAKVLRFLQQIEGIIKLIPGFGA